MYSFKSKICLYICYLLKKYCLYNILNRVYENKVKYDKNYEYNFV